LTTRKGRLKQQQLAGGKLPHLAGGETDIELVTVQSVLEVHQ